MHTRTFALFAPRVKAVHRPLLAGKENDEACPGQQGVFLSPERELESEEQICQSLCLAE